MFILTKGRIIKEKKNGSELLDKEGIDFQTILLFTTEEEALEVATKKLRENPHSKYMIFVLNHIIRTTEAPLQIENVLDGIISKG